MSYCSITLKIQHRCPLLVYSAVANRNEKAEFLNEIDMMKKIAKGNNPHIVNLVGCITVEEPLCLLMEYSKYGDLLSYLQSIRKMVRCCVAGPWTRATLL